MRVSFREYVVVGAVLALGACSSSYEPEGTRRVETWGTETTWVDGKAVTKDTHSVDFEKIPDPPKAGVEVSLSGIWNIHDYTDTAQGNRRCYVDLQTQKVAGHDYFKVSITGQCPSEMHNVAVWRPVGNPEGDAIVMLDASGKRVGEFDKTTSRNLFRGVFTLASGEVVKAHLKRW